MFRCEPKNRKTLIRIFDNRQIKFKAQLTVSDERGPYKTFFVIKLPGYKFRFNSDISVKKSSCPNTEKMGITILNPENKFKTHNFVLNIKQYFLHLNFCTQLHDRQGVCATGRNLLVTWQLAAGIKWFYRLKSVTIFLTFLSPN